MRLLTYILIIILHFSIFSCKTSTILTEKRKKQTFNNNSVSIVSNSVDYSLNNSNKLIFEGSNNEILYEYLDCIFNSRNSRNVTIIKGNGNKIKIKLEGVVDNSVDRNDTLIFKGSNNEIEILQQFFIDNSVSKSDENTIETYQKKFKIEIEDEALIKDSSTMENKLTNIWTSTYEIFNFYLKETITGNDSAAFYLGELYQLGVGTKLDIKKAVKYYSIAAKVGHSEAQSSLGYIYENDYVGVEKNINTAIYWYEKSAKSGNEFAINRLRILKQ